MFELWDILVLVFMMLFSVKKKKNPAVWPSRSKGKSSKGVNSYASQVEPGLSDLFIYRKYH